MLSTVITDRQERLPQTSDGCAIACAAMSLHALHGMPARRTYDDLYRRLNPVGVGVTLHELAQTIRHRYRRNVLAGRHAELVRVLGYGRLGALTIGVRPEHLYAVPPGALHAVYVAATEHPHDDFSKLSRWRPSLQFTPPPDIIDPAPRTPARHTWTYEDLAIAFTGDWMLVLV